MLFHIVSVSVQQKLKALTKFEIYENSKKLKKKSEKMQKKCKKNAEKMRKKCEKNAKKIGKKFSKWHGFLKNFRGVTYCNWRESYICIFLILCSIFVGERSNVQLNVYSYSGTMISFCFWKQS